MNATDHRDLPVPPARIAGILYLVVTVGGAAALLIFSSLVVRGDAAATAGRLLASEHLFRLGFVANLVATSAYLGVAGLLYEVFKPVSRGFSLVAAFLAVAGCAAGAAMSLHQLAPFVLLNGAPYLVVVGTDQLRAMAMSSLRLNAIGGSISLTFFGFYCLLLGCLIIRSRFIPRLIGLLLFVGGLAWLANSFAALLLIRLPGNISTYLMAASIGAECVFTLWLLLMGINAAGWREAARRAGLGDH